MRISDWSSDVCSSDLPSRCNDIDFCLRLNVAGYRNVFTPHADLFHHEFTTCSYEISCCKNIDFSNELNYMNSQWKEMFSSDPAYSPNLTLEHEDFRSEEHTSELQSLMRISYAVFCLKQKKNK